MSSFSEKEIIEGCIIKNRIVQKILYDMYAPKFYTICLRYVNNKVEADDILQEGFLKIFNNISSFSKENSFEGWMRKIIINTALSYYKKNKKFYNQVSVENIENETFLFEEFDFTQEELLGIIQSLPSGYRTTFNLFAIDGYKHKEIANMLKIDESTSKSQFFRARKTIQQKLKELSKEKLTVYG